jgi:ectoine hydroxylase-related dioxygenase (phytanoyl-CoA dioxygenase family)
MGEVITKDHIEQYWEEGYTIIRGVFDEYEIEEMKRAIDRWKQYGLLLGSTWRKQNTVIWVNNGQKPVVRGMQWPSYHDAILDRFRTDPRFLEIVEPFIGTDVKQIINQVHWKKPGSSVSWPLHRDVRSRKPDSAFQDVFRNYVQTGTAIDPHREENGAMNVVPGSHKDVAHDPADQSIWNVPQYKDDERIKPLEMDPGDVALWSTYTVHGGGLNTTQFLDRRFYINGFVRADACSRGEWVWKDGKTQKLGSKQALIQFEEVDSLTEGFYVRERNATERVRD